jgi:hypothetical protein
VGRNCEKNVIDVIFKVNTGVSSTILSSRTLALLHLQCGLKKKIIREDLVRINERIQRAFTIGSFKDG